MARLFRVRVQTASERDQFVVGETPEEAQSKVVVQEGETIVAVEDNGEVTV